MKKRILSFICFAVLLFSLMSTVAFADAATYDMDVVDYYVYVTTPDGGLNMRHGPGTEYDKVMDERIPDGIKLHIELTSGNWGYTSYNGNNGWVALKQTSVNPPEPVVVQQEEVKPVAPPVQEPVSEPIETPDEEVVVESDIADEPVNISEPINENNDVETDVADSDNVNVAENSAKDFMSSQILMIAILILLIVILAIAIVIVINLKSRR